MLFAPTSNASATELRQDYSRRQKLGRAIVASDCSSLASWPTATAGGAKSSGAAGYGPTATHHVGTTLTDATERRLNWPTPNAASDSRNSGTGVDPKVRAEQGRQIMLQDVVKVWPTPRTITGGAESATRKQELGRTASGGGDLQATEQAWPTPTSTMTAGDDLRATWMPGSNPVRDDGKKLQNALTTCSQIWDRSRPDRPTLTDGDGSSTRDQTSRPRLNPQFVEWLMGVPVGWTDFAPLETAWFRWWLLMRSCLFGLVSTVVKNERTAGKTD
jgi:hypothetical protein